MNRLLIKRIGELLLTGVFVSWWQYHDYVEQKDGEQKILNADASGAKKQADIDAKKLEEANNAHFKEVQDLKQAYLTPIVIPPSIVRVNPSTQNNVPAANTCTHSDSTPVVVPTDVQLHFDQQRAFKMLLERADGLSADARRLNTAEQ